MQLPDMAKTHFRLKNNPGELNALWYCSYIFFFLDDFLMIDFQECNILSQMVWAFVTLWLWIFQILSRKHTHSQQPCLWMSISSHLHSHCVFSYWKDFSYLTGTPPKKFFLKAILFYLTSLCNLDSTIFSTFPENFKSSLWEPPDEIFG